MPPASGEIVIWDRFVRLFHWSAVSLFFMDFWVLEAGDLPHERAGYALGLLLSARIAWGFIGSPNARFARFYPTPARIYAHVVKLRQGLIDPTEGHNPLGGAMILFLLLMLGLTVASGWLLTWDSFWGEDWLEDLHGLFADITLGAASIHVSAAVVMGYVQGMPLIRTMITGKRTVFRKH